VLADSWTLNMEAVHSLKMPVNFYRTIWRYIPEGSSHVTKHKALDEFFETIQEKDSSGSGQDPVAVSCDHRNESSRNLFTS
jgi:hypothetical protein